MATVADMAIELAEAFEARTRADGTEYTCLRDDAPEWARDAVMMAHGDALPNDWMYAACADAARDIASRGDVDDECAYIWADHTADVYHHALARWLADVPGAWGACEEARDECAGQVDSLDDLLRRGQFTMLASIYQELALAIELEGVEA